MKKRIIALFMAISIIVPMIGTHVVLAEEDIDNKQSDTLAENDIELYDPDKEYEVGDTVIMADGDTV